MDTTPAERPRHTTIEGRYVTLQPLNADAHAHAHVLFNSVQGHDSLWDYMSDGPFPDRAAFRASIEKKAVSSDPLYFAIIDNQSADAVGYASYLRIEPSHRVIEVGNILYTPRLQRTRGATEAMFLMARHAFEDLRYRRYEWKCNALNEPSRRAALRLGFRFEGIFRQHMIVKGRNRDTSWYAMLDGEWPDRKADFERWLSPENFDAEGRQIRKLVGQVSR
jgi:RimJ/RimL family protein N-acetyltransferase